MQFPLTIKLVGVSFGNAQDNIKNFGSSDFGPYSLIREPDNKFDSNAIKVSLFGLFDFGYLPKNTAEMMAPMIDTGLQFEAHFVRITQFPPHELRGIMVKIYEVN
jgi:hypothetical protein